MNHRILNLTEANLSEHPQFVCFINPKHPTYHHKVDWVQHQLQLGLRIKLLYPENEKKAQGFIEYTPGEHAWRAVEAMDYMFIHCLWIGSNKWKGLGLGSQLIRECIDDAQRSGMNGVAVLTSTDAFLAKADIFIKNGFVEVDRCSPGFSLLAKQFKASTPPKIKDNSARLGSYQGLHLLYSAQCPWVARFVCELKDFATGNGLQIKVSEFTTPQEAQHSPSPYGVFNLIHNGKLLADHYISLTRLTNILKKERLM